MVWLDLLDLGQKIELKENRGRPKFIIWPGSRQGNSRVTMGQIQLLTGSSVSSGGDGSSDLRTDTGEMRGEI